MSVGEAGVADSASAYDADTVTIDSNGTTDAVTLHKVDIGVR